jgi:hypothetical protein
MTTLTSAELAAELASLGIAFVENSIADKLPISPRPELFLAGLASSTEARLRMALIPLFLARPEFIRSVPDAVHTLSGQARITLMCYYTAAMLLQQKYSQNLTTLGISIMAMPDLFSHELALPQKGEADVILKQLGDRQAALSGRPLNWYGTYEQAVRRFMRRLHQERMWAAN